MPEITDFLKMKGYQIFHAGLIIASLTVTGMTYIFIFNYEIAELNPVTFLALSTSFSLPFYLFAYIAATLFHRRTLLRFFKSHFGRLCNMNTKNKREIRRDIINKWNYAFYGYHLPLLSILIFYLTLLLYFLLIVLKISTLCYQPVFWFITFIVAGILTLYMHCKLKNTEKELEKKIKKYDKLKEEWELSM